MKRLEQLTFEVTSLTKLMLTLPVQLSVAVTDAVFCAGTEPAQVTVTGAGTVICGATLSLTVITWVQIAVLLHRSAAR